MPSCAAPFPGTSTGSAREEVAVLEVEAPLRDEVQGTFLERRRPGSSKVVTVIEQLSPANKVHPGGREEYEAKRDDILRTRRNLVGVDLLRSGEPMPVHAKGPIEADHPILVTRGTLRPRGQLHAFSLRQPIPNFRLPLLPGDEVPELDLHRVLHELHERAGFDVRIDHPRPAGPPPGAEDAAWAGERVRAVSAS